MKTRPVLISLLVAAHVSIAMAVVAGARLPVKYGDWLPLAVVSTGQIGLLSIWTALGRRAAPLRPAVLITVIFVWSWIMAVENGNGPHITAIFIPMSIMLVAVFLVARMLGFQIHLPENDHFDRNNRWQFTLRSLFAWTTSIAFCLGLIIFVLQDSRLNPNVKWPDVIIMAANFVVVIIVASVYFACIMPRHGYLFCTVVYAILMAMLLACGCLGTQLSYVIAIYCIPEISLLVASLLVLRVAGYRLEKKAGRRQFGETGKDSSVTLYGL